MVRGCGVATLINVAVAWVLHKHVDVAGTFDPSIDLFLNGKSFTSSEYSCWPGRARRTFGERTQSR